MEAARQPQRDDARAGTRPPYAVAARELLRTSLFDAARELMVARDWADLTMAEIALAAGVSRQTLYNEFGSRDRFAQEFVMHEGDSFILAVEDAINAHLDDPRAALETAFDVFLTAAAEDPMVRNVVFGDGPGGLLPLVTTRGKPLVERAAERLSGIIVSGWPMVPRPEAELLAECMVRLAISYAALPKGPANMTAASVTKMLGPYLERLVTA